MATLVPAGAREIWTEEQVDNLNRYQKVGFFHEYTCRDDHDGARAMVATKHGLVCPSCGYRQTRVGTFQLEFTAEKEEKIREEYRALGIIR